MDNLNKFYKSGIIAIVGRTNVGKSTLLNNFVSEKVSIVSDRVQTTRNLIRAILTKQNGQLVFLDTPGVHKAESHLGKNMNKLSRGSVKGTDAIILVLDISNLPDQIDDGWFRRLSNTHIPCIFVLNKSDLKINYENKYKELWSIIKNETSSVLNPDWICISALHGKGIKLLLDKLFNIVPVGEQLFPSNVLTDYPRKLNIADIIREKFFNRLHHELPHSLAIWIDNIIKIEDKSNVYVSIYIERHSQKGIIIGKNGCLIKSVKKEAEKELSEMYECIFLLKMSIKVEKNWKKNSLFLKKLGYL